MSTFRVPVVEITISEHPDADKLEIARATNMDYNMIVPKGVYHTGDTVIYIPEQSIVPDSLLEDLGLTGKLAGRKHNRVKAIRLRGIISQGIVYPNHTEAEVGTDMAETLGITKYEVPIPIGMKGEVCNLGYEYTIKFDVDNFKNHPNVFTSDDFVEITEKIHGTFMMVGSFPENGHTHPEIIDERSFCGSKGLVNRGLVFKDNEENKNNLYLRATKKLNLHTISQSLSDRYGSEVCLLGEVFGKGVQDLAYGFKTNDVQFRLFDICIISDSGIEWVDRKTIVDICSEFNLSMATVLYVGPFCKDKIIELTEGKETISGASSHIREGIVIRDLNPAASHQDIGRKILKNVSFAYLNRKGGTEYN